MELWNHRVLDWNRVTRHMEGSYGRNGTVVALYERVMPLVPSSVGIYDVQRCYRNMEQTCRKWCQVTQVQALTIATVNVLGANNINVRRRETKKKRNDNETSRTNHEKRSAGGGRGCLRRVNASRWDCCHPIIWVAAASAESPTPGCECERRLHSNLRRAGGTLTRLQTSQGYMYELEPTVSGSEPLTKQTEYLRVGETCNLLTLAFRGLASCS